MGCAGKVLNLLAPKLTLTLNPTKGRDRELLGGRGESWESGRGEKSTTPTGVAAVQFNQRGYSILYRFCKL